MSIPPPTGPDFDAAVLRTRVKIDRRLEQHTKKRRQWFQRGGAALAAILLFGGGVAVGGSALLPFSGAKPALTVACYPAQTATSTSFQLSYTTDTDAANARKNPTSACTQGQLQTDLLNGVNTIVRGLITDGHTCGTIHLTDGSTWSYKDDPHNGLGIVSGTPIPPLGPECVVREGVTLPPSKPAPSVACSVNSSLINVYPADPKKAAALCQSKGYTAANQ